MRIPERLSRKLLGKGRHAGFTLVEVVFALGILLLGMTVILSLLTFGAALGRSAALRTSAATSIEAVLADLEETLFPLDEEGNAGEPEVIEERGIEGTDIVYSARAFENPDQPLEYRLDVELRWQAAGVQRTKKFSTLMLRQIPFGERLRREFVEGVAPSKPDVPGSR